MHSNKKVMLKKVLILVVFFQSISPSYAQENCLFKNPLCFYNTDILTYLQVLHKNQQYEKMTPFFYGPYLNNSNTDLVNKLSNVDFGYSLKRVGVKEMEKNKWSLTYQRTIMGTNENFKIECALINDTCRIFIDQNQWNKIFEK
jgi:hypothetical protein